MMLRFPSGSVASRPRSAFAHAALATVSCASACGLRGCNPNVLAFEEDMDEQKPYVHTEKFWSALGLLLYPQSSSAHEYLQEKKQISYICHKDDTDRQ